MRPRRPAGSALLDDQTDVVGIPAFLPMDPGSTAGFYFVTAREAARATSNGAQPGSQASTGVLYEGFRVLGVQYCQSCLLSDLKC